MRRDLPALLALFLALLAGTAGAAKPARIFMGYHEMGATYDWFDLREKFAHQLYYRSSGAETCTLDWSRLQDYSTVIVCVGMRGTPKVTPQQAASIEEFVQQGGNLVIVGAALEYFSDPNVAARLHGIQLLRNAKPAACRGTSPEHPLFSVLGAEPIQATPMGIKPEGGRVLLADEKQNVAAFERQIGAGYVLLLPQELFPPFGPGRSIADDKLDPRVRPFLARLFEHLHVPLFEQAVREGVAGSRLRNRTLTPWYRPPDHYVFQGAHMLAPPYPVHEREVLTQIRRQVGIDEHERVPIYLTARDVQGPVSIQLRQRTRKKPDLFANARVRVQGRPAEHRTGPTVYLSDLARDGDKLLLDVAACDTKTLWLQFDTRGASPGTYAGEVAFTAGGRTQKVAIQLEVFDAPIPAYHRLHFEIEANTLAAYIQGKRENLIAAVDDFEAAHVDCLMMSPIMYNDAKISGTGELLSSFLRPENRARFERGDLPGINFSDYDWYFQEAIQRGLITHRGYQWYNADRYAPMVARMCGQPSVAPDSAEMRRFYDWYLAEVLRYLRERGYRFIYLKWGDEWGPDQLDWICNSTMPLKKLGWGIVLNPNGKSVVSVPAMRERLLGLIDCWMMNDGMPHYREAVAEVAKRREIVSPDGLMLVTTSSWWWNQPLDTGWYHGYTMAHNDVRAFHYHGWTRGGNHGAYLDNSDGRFVIHPSISYQLMGEGLEESEYLVLAKQLVRHAQKRGLDVAQYQKRLDSLVGEGTDKLIPMQYEEAFAMPAPGPRLGARVPMEKYQDAKARLLPMVAELRARLGPAQRKLRWGYAWLHEGGRAPLRIGHGTDLESQAKHLARLFDMKSEGTTTVRLEACGTEPPAPGKDVCFWLVDTRDKNAVGALKQRFASLAVGDDYPAKGSYALYGPLAWGDGHLVIIAGHGPEGVALGNECFVRFVEDVYAE